MAAKANANLPLSEFELLGSKYTVLPKPVVWIDDINREVAYYYQLKVAELLSKRRTRDITRPRQAAMWLAKKLTRRSLPEIGRKISGKDHTTVIHALKAIDKLIAQDDEVARDLVILLAKFPNVLRDGLPAMVSPSSTSLERKIRQAIAENGPEALIAEILLDPDAARRRFAVWT
jgi:hypothetical protein